MKPAIKQKIQPQEIKQLLNSSLSRIEQPALDRLHDIRKQALARYASHATAPALATAGDLVFYAQRKSYHWVMTALLAACLGSAIIYWQHGTERNMGDEDIAILTDDIPVHMYVE